MNYPTQSTLANHLEEIVIKECYNENKEEESEANEDKINISKEHFEQIELISKDNHCDIRSCLNRLQFNFSSIKNSNSTLAEQGEKINKLDSNDKESEMNVNLQLYNNLILSDLLLSDHFHINSRDELDNSCISEENLSIKKFKR